MKTLSTNILCPSCNSQMKPKVMACNSCEIEVKGNFELLEFAQLNSDELHFLRVFIHCEGRIRDLEKALGVSYPTVKSKISSIKSKLSSKPIEQNIEVPMKSNQSVAANILDQLNSGKITYQEALKKIKKGE